MLSHDGCSLHSRDYIFECVSSTWTPHSQLVESGAAALTTVGCLKALPAGHFYLDLALFDLFLDLIRGKS
jgi:hypothetical protein